MDSYDKEAVRSSASGRWVQILGNIGHLRSDWLDGRAHPCPKCGGKDRFRMIDSEAGALLCNQCFRSNNGDGFAALMWLTGMGFHESLKRVAEFCGIKPLNNGGKKKIDPSRDLEFRPWNDSLIALWCLKKQPIKPNAIKAVGGRLARYKNQWTVIALPVCGKELDHAKPVGWVLYSVNGGMLPAWGADGSVEYVKIKTMPGTEPGLIGTFGPHNRIIKTEGPSDLLALISMGLAENEIACCNVHGCKENPAKTPWLQDFFSGHDVVVIHDADEEGLAGATTVGERIGWAPFAATTAASCKLAKLPFKVTPNHGKDLRDFFAEGATRSDFDRLIDQAEVIADPGPIIKPNESDDDYHRLARVNLQQYASRHGGRTLRYWRDEWYVWKDTHYRRITEKELRAKITYSVKREFDRINIQKIEDYEHRKSKGEIKDEEDKGPPFVKKVSISLLASVLNATAGMTNLSSSVEPMTWLPTRQRKNYVAMANGIIDMDAVIADRDDYLIPHSPEWFSTTCLPYAFDANATCPKWDAFLERNLEMDPERIKLLQEWAGYLLLPDTGQQKFLVLEGEGANGKSVFCAGIEAMLGAANVSHVPLEVFGEKFELTTTLDRLANICGDAGELDKVAEGHIKAFTAGNPMSFGRKYLDSVERTPTARLMLACNNRPRFSDRSDGIWRRMLLVPWRIQIAPEDRIPNMDKPWWWEQSGELPGILLWAIQGLHRLQQQGRFTDSEVCDEALGDYRAEMNPARTFLIEHCEQSDTSRIWTAKLYSLYVTWSKHNGHHPLSERQFGKELARVFRKVKKRRAGTNRGRDQFYDGLCFSCDEICGENISESLFF